MPGVIMENGDRNGAYTNHNRDSKTNGLNGTSHATDRTNEKSKSDMDDQPGVSQRPVPNGINSQEKLSEAAPSNTPVAAGTIGLLKQLPEEIEHITLNFQPLSGLLSRLAQATHNRLNKKLLELASMPMPQSALNGNGASPVAIPDDNSVENIRKKVALLKHAEDTHASWTKALVITQWSRRAQDVGKMIDLKVHLDQRRLLYNQSIAELGEAKRSLLNARLLNPDLRTAVEVFSTGKTSCMPDLEYLEPPPLTSQDLLMSLDNLNTLLSIRLSLHEYDKIPPFFSNYNIASGRVTFIAAGEFEVDLTIADEDPDSQFWFIDFRFLFKPAALQIPENLRHVIESRVNAALEKDGLRGCYNFLHELVLTQKIAELRRQAVDLSRGRWVETLNVELLQRALSLQYWAGRSLKDGPKSWIIIGVTSGRRHGHPGSPKDSSRIAIRWFRDAKEVKDAAIFLDQDHLSAETLLREVINQHISHILSSTYTKLRTKALFADKMLSLAFSPSNSFSEPELVAQLTADETINISIEPMSGSFAISPASRLTSQTEWKLNEATKDPATNANEYIENLRCVSVVEAIICRALSVGWIPVRRPVGLKQEDLKSIVPKDTLQLSWFRRAGWSTAWFVALSSSMSGERWWLIELAGTHSEMKVKNHFQIPLQSASPEPTHNFLSGLQLMASAMLTYYVNLRALHSQKARSIVQRQSIARIEPALRLPSIFVSLQTLLPGSGKSQAWAADFLKLRFHGVEISTRKTPLLPRMDSSVIEGAETSFESDVEERAVMIAEGRMSQPIPPRLLVKKRIDKDIAFHPTSGAFAFRLQNTIGLTSIASLTQRLERVRQLVQMVQIIKRHEKDFTFDAISLGRIAFTYDHQMKLSGEDLRDILSTPYRASVEFSGTGQPLSLVLDEHSPHIRILDILLRMLNSELGLEGVANTLPITLTLLRGFNLVEENWAMSEKGDVVVFCRAVDWYTIRYTLSADSQSERVVFSIRLQRRRKVPFWCIQRERDSRVPSDRIDNVLKTVWEDEGASWKGMQTSGIAEPAGAEELIGRVDTAMRGIADSGIWKPGGQPLPSSGHNDLPSGRQQSGDGQVKQETIVID